jgi:ABC-type cobalamin transport system ATPase subunit
MGASGAGKTTLLDVLANRKTSGVVGGTKRVNGHEISPFSFARISGFSEQEDLHMPTTTVREALAFSATLRLEADVTPAQREAHVEEVLRMLELLPLANRLVGTLAPGELKRLTLVRRRIHACVVVVPCGCGAACMREGAECAGLSAVGSLLLLECTSCHLRPENLRSLPPAPSFTHARGHPSPFLCPFALLAGRGARQRPLHHLRR